MRKTTKLLAVVMWIGAGQASADPISDADDEVTAAKVDVERAEFDRSVAIELYGLTRPRVLATGSPACGNTMGGKSDYEEDDCNAQTQNRRHSEAGQEVLRTVAETARAEAKLRKAMRALDAVEARAPKAKAHPIVVAERAK